jgi:uncharacterized membrane protein
MTTAQIQAARWSFVALAMAGAGIGGFLTVIHWADKPVICGGLGSCATVQSSAYAAIAGVPVALLGLLLYLTIGACAVLAGGGGRGRCSPSSVWHSAACSTAAI